MNAYLFDVDGVLSNLKQSVNVELIAKLSHILINGDPLALISGRGLDWQIENVVKPIETYLAENSHDSKRLIDNLIVSGEFGGVRVIHENGERISKIDDSVALPQELKEKLTEIAQDYNDIIFVEHEKQTMFSSPKHTEGAFEKFESIKAEVVAKYEEVLSDFPDFKIGTDRFSINIKNKKANKRYATEQVINWLTERNIHPDHFYAFGDSVSDLEIGEELFARDLPMKFIFVGRKEELEGHTVQFPYEVTKADFDLGTLEFLNS